MIVNEDQTSSAKSRVDGDYERYIRPLEDRLLRTLWRVVQDPLQGLLERLLVWSCAPLGLDCRLQGGQERSGKRFEGDF